MKSCLDVPRVMPLLNNNKRNWRLIILLNLLASLSDGHQLVGKNRQELSFAAAVSEHDQFLRLSSSVLFEEPQQKFLGDILHVLDDLFVALNAHVLDSHLNFIIDSFWIHTSNNGGDTWLDSTRFWSRMGDVSSHDHDWSFEDGRPAGSGQDVVDSTKLGVDLEADVGDDLTLGLVVPWVKQDLLYTTLGRNFVLDVSKLFYFIVNPPSFEGKND